MRTDIATGLVLEGGGMRGIFTVGVLDYLMDNQLWFPYVPAMVFLIFPDNVDGPISAI